MLRELLAKASRLQGDTPRSSIRSGGQKATRVPLGSSCGAAPSGKSKLPTSRQPPRRRCPAGMRPSCGVLSRRRILDNQTVPTDWVDSWMAWRLLNIGIHARLCSVLVASSADHCSAGQYIRRICTISTSKQHRSPHTSYWSTSPVNAKVMDP